MLSDEIGGGTNTNQLGSTEHTLISGGTDENLEPGNLDKVDPTSAPLMAKTSNAGDRDDAYHDHADGVERVEQGDALPPLASLATGQTTHQDRPSESAGNVAVAAATAANGPRRGTYEVTVVCEGVASGVAENDEGTGEASGAIETALQQQQRQQQQQHKAAPSHGTGYALAPNSRMINTPPDLLNSHRQTEQRLHNRPTNHHIKSDNNPLNPLHSQEKHSHDHKSGIVRSGPPVTDTPITSSHIPANCTGMVTTCTEGVADIKSLLDGETQAGKMAARFLLGGTKNDLMTEGYASDLPEEGRHTPHPPHHHTPQAPQKKQNERNPHTTSSHLSEEATKHVPKTAHAPHPPPHRGGRTRMPGSGDSVGSVGDGSSGGSCRHAATETQQLRVRSAFSAKQREPVRLAEIAASGPLVVDTEPGAVAVRGDYRGGDDNGDTLEGKLFNRDEGRVGGRAEGSEKREWSKRAHVLLAS